jgi:hypothetical protein
MSTEQPTEEELRAAYEAEVKKIRVEHVLLEHVVSLVNLGMRRTGLSPGTEDERDVEQVRLAIDGIRVMLPLLEQTAPQQVKPVRDALSQLQLAFVKIGGSQSQSAPGQEVPGQEAPEHEAPAPAGGHGEQPAEPAEQSKSGEAGPAQRSGRLWVPGQ